MRQNRLLRAFLSEERLQNNAMYQDHSTKVLEFLELTASSGGKSGQRPIVG